MKTIIILFLMSIPCVAGYQSFTNSKGEIDTLIIGDTIRNLDRTKVDNFRVYTTTPTVTDIKEAQIVLFYSDGAFRIYTKINGLIKYVDLK